MTNNDQINNFNKLLNSIDHSKNIITVFPNFLRLSAYSLAQHFYRSAEIENRYISVARIA